jgi:hypothetical protein
MESWKNFSQAREKQIRREQAVTDRAIRRKSRIRWMIFTVIFVLFMIVWLHP